jgi:hypothetical protein
MNARTSRLVLVFGSLFICALMARAQEPSLLRDQLFAEADQALMTANAAVANVLAPKSYEEAARAYQDADAALQRGRSLEGIREDLAQAVASFKASVEQQKSPV